MGGERLFGMIEIYGSNLKPIGDRRRAHETYILISVLFVHRYEIVLILIFSFNCQQNGDSVDTFQFIVTILAWGNTWIKAT